MTVFVDTSAFLALLNRDDALFAPARRVWARLAAERAQLVTSSYVLVESAALIQNRLGLQALRDFHGDITPLLQTVWVTEELHDQAMTALLSANQRRLSLVDCVSFAVCRRQQVAHVFAFDQHFQAQGFDCLGPD
jgi:predicted nucleic acid-binding protein